MRSGLKKWLAVILAAAMTILPAFSSLAADEWTYPYALSGIPQAEWPNLAGLFPDGFMPVMASPSDMGGSFIPGGSFGNIPTQDPGGLPGGAFAQMPGEVFGGIAGEPFKGTYGEAFEGIPGGNSGKASGEIFGDISEGIPAEIPGGFFDRTAGGYSEAVGENGMETIEDGIGNDAETDEAVTDADTEEDGEDSAANEEDGERYAKLLFYDFGKMPSEAELLSGYIDSFFFEDTDDRPFSNYRLTRFSGDEHDFYVALSDFIEEIAAGDEEYPVFDARNTAPTLRLNREKLDLNESATNIEWYEAAMNYYLKNVINVRQVINAIYSENPCDFYWAQGTYIVSFSASIENDQCVISIPLVYFPAGDDYMGDYASDLSDDQVRYRIYNVSNEEVPQAVFAAGTAHRIAKEHAAEPVAEMLSSFRDEICELASNDTDPSDISGFDDPWQIVYVFDGDPLTTANSEGYAKAFKSLCDINGIDTCYTIAGTMSGRAHMWNILRLGDELYLVDVSCSDTGMVGENGSLFMVSLDGILTSSGTDYSFNPTGSSAAEYVFDARQAKWDN